MFRFVAKNLSINNDQQLIVKLIKNVDFFEFDYENSIDINQFIVNVKRYNFYCNVYIFIDHLKNLKKIILNFKIKKLIVICFKKLILR